jgi:RecB family endonuclease NucS
MPLFEITANQLRPLATASLSEMRVRERGDLQRLLRSQIDVLGEDLLVLAEEFGDWEDSRRRIDLLAVDSQANLVVIELKRTADGGQMELQAFGTPA